MLLQKEWNQYGDKNFKFVTLFECNTKADILFMPQCEMKWFEITQATDRKYGYNTYEGMEINESVLEKMNIC